MGAVAQGHAVELGLNMGGALKRQLYRQSIATLP